MTDTRNIVPSVQSALSPHKHWAERHFASEFGTRHLGGGRSTGLGGLPPHPGRPLRGLPIGQADGDRTHSMTQSRSPAGLSPGRDGKSSTACLCSPAAAPLRGGGGNTQGRRSAGETSPVLADACDRIGKIQQVVITVCLAAARRPPFRSPPTGGNGILHDLCGLSREV